MALIDIYYSLEDWLYDRGIDPKLFFGAVAALFVVGIGYWLFAGANTADVTIVVADAETGLAIEGASVTVRHTGGIMQGITGKEGRYSFLVPLDAELEIDVKAENYRDVKARKVIAEKGLLEGIGLVSVASFSGKNLRRIQLLGADGKVLQGEVSMRLACSNGKVKPSPVEGTTRNGEFEVEVPEECGKLLVIAKAVGFEQASFVVDRAYKVVRLSPREGAKGVAVVKVGNAQGEILDGMKVSMYAEDGTLKRKLYTAWGEARFSLPSGEYYAVIEDEKLVYAPERAEFMVMPNQVDEREIVLLKSIKAVLDVEVVDSSTLLPIDFAEVSVLSGNAIVASGTLRQGESRARIALKDAGDYKIRAFHEDYLYSGDIDLKVEAAGSAKEVDVRIELERMSLENSGRVRVYVTDVENVPIENASVTIFDAQTEFATPWQQGSDVNGIVDFFGVTEGSYFLVAEKMMDRQVSPIFDMDIRKQHEQVLKIQFRKGTAAVLVVNEDGVPVEKAEVEFITSEGREKYMANAEGIASVEMVSGTEFRARVSKEGMLTYHTEEIVVLPNQIVSAKARMYMEPMQNEPEVVLEGIYAEGQEVVVLNAGTTYKAKFLLKVPSNVKFSEFGMHFRVGDSEEMATDSIYIGRVTARDGFVMKGATYRPEQGGDAENTTEGFAKWANVSWVGEESGLYLAEVEFTVRGATKAGKELPIFYRAWGIDGAGGYYLDPLDAQVPAVGPLYANSYSKYFYEGRIPVCKEGFCESTRVYDEEQGLYLRAPYSLEIYRPYLVKFRVSNGGIADYTDAELRVGTDSLKIGKYEVMDADLGIAGSDDADAYEFGGIPLGNFAQNREVSGEFYITGMQTGQKSLALEIVSGGEVVYSGQTMVNVAAESRMEVSLADEAIPAFDLVNMEIAVRYASGEEYEGKGVENAYVTLTRILQDGSESELHGYTNSAGKIILPVYPSSPGTRIKVTAHKAGFEQATAQRTVGGSLVEISPGSLNFALKANDPAAEEGFAELEIENLLARDIVISGLEAFGEGPIDYAKMNGWLREQYSGGLVIAAGSSEKINVKAVLISAEIIEQSGNYEGGLLVEVAHPLGFEAYRYGVGLAVSVNPASVPSEGCISLSEVRWDETSLGGSLYREFEITNYCEYANDEPRDIHDVRFRLQDAAAGEDIGYLTVVVGREGRESPELVMNRQVWTEVGLGRMEYGVPYTVGLKFVPKPNSTGKEASFFVEVQGTEIGEQGEVGIGQPSRYEGNLLITNLHDCVKVTPEQGTKIGKEEEATGTFKVDTTRCKNLDIEMRFCYRGNEIDKCRGGTNEGGIELEGIGANWKLNLSEDTVNVTARRVSGIQIPGYYGVNVEAKVRGRDWTKLKTVPVVVEPLEHRYFRLDRYKFDLVPTPGIDEEPTAVAKLTNRMVEEQVSVKASLCCWEDFWNKNWDSQGASLGAGLGVSLATGVITASLVTGASGIVSIGAGAAAATSLGGLSGLGSYVLAVGGAVGPVGWIAAGAVFVGAMVIGGIAGQKSCQSFRETKPLQDYVINLTGSANPSYERYVNPDTICSNTGKQHERYEATPCDHNGSFQELPDCEVNQTPCEIYVESGASEYITAEWFFASSDLTVSEEGQATQEIDLLFTHTPDTQGNYYAGDAESYGVVEVKAVEHIHGDADHEEASVAGNCGGEKGVFGPYWIGAAPEHCTGGSAPSWRDSLLDGQGCCSPREQNREVYDTTYSQKFHVMFETEREEEVLPVIDFDSEGCGEFGSSNSPKVKFNWGWNEQRGITEYTCLPEEQGGEGIYCDATQFSILVSKRLYRLYEFLNRNNFSLECPPATDPAYYEELQRQFNTQNSSARIETLRAGAESINVQFEGRTAKVITTLKNNTPDVQLVDLTVGITKQGYEAYCRKVDVLVADIGARDAKVVCEFPNLAPGRYAAVARAVSAEPGELQETAISIGFEMPGASGGEGDCKMAKTTLNRMGEPIINRFIRASEFNPTARIQNAQDMTELLEFDAYLMKDAFSPDFLTDFSDYYTNVNLADTPTWFANLVSEGGESFGINKFFKERLIVFTRSSAESPLIQSPGKYRVSMALTFLGEDGGTGTNWNFFGKDGNPVVAVGIEMRKVEDSGVQSPFYYLPFDGALGFNSGTGRLEREGYGTAFVSEQGSNLVRVNEGEAGSGILWTYPSEGSSAVTKATVKEVGDFHTLNINPETRGNLLDVSMKGNGEVEIVLSPNKPSPLIMKASADEESLAEGMLAAYGISENEQPLNEWETMNYWSGVGQCRDFSGEYVWTSLRGEPDFRNEPGGEDSEWPNDYALKWEDVSAEAAGDVYLRGIFYLPPQGQYLARAGNRGIVEGFITPEYPRGNALENAGESVDLEGSVPDTASIEKIFRDIGKGKYCIRNTGTRTSAFWNPQAVYSGFEGQDNNLSEISNCLGSGNYVIGNENACAKQEYSGWDWQSCTPVQS